MIGIASDDRKPQQGFQGRGIAAPAPIAPPQEQPSIASQFATQAMNRGIDTAIEGGAGIAKKYGTPLLEKGMAALKPTPMGPSFQDEALGKSFLSSATAPAAPTMSSVATPLMKSGVDAGLANAVASQSAGAAGSAAAGSAGAAAGGAGAAAGAGGMAALGTAVPYIGAGLIAGKALGLFSEGGEVTLESAMQIKDKDKRLDALLKALEGMADSEIKEERAKLGLSNNYAEGSDGPVGFNPYLSEAMKRKENDFNNSRPLQTESAGNMGSVRTAGPLSKIKYKSAGGEVYELSYGGGPLKG